jgi:transcriptional regulator with XRE-family HTH domain
MGKTKAECAEEMGLNISSVNKYLTGERYPDIEAEEKIQAWVDNLMGTAKGRRTSGARVAQAGAGPQSARHNKADSKQAPKAKEESTPAPSPLIVYNDKNIYK